MGSGQDWQADAEERIADAEHAVETRLHDLADRLPDSEAVHSGADVISAQGERHRDRARRLRRSGPDEGRNAG